MPINDPIAHWKFDETSGLNAADSAAGNFPGTLTGTAPGWRSGKLNNAVDLPGTNEYVAIGRMPHLETADAAFTVAFWIYFDTLSLAGGNMIWYGKDGDSRHSFYIPGTNGDWVIDWFDDLSGYYDIALSGANANVAAEWTHLAWTVSATSAQAYRNGAAVASAEGHNGWKAGDNTLQWHIGRPGLSPSINGAYDDVRFYDRELSSSEILELYNFIYDIRQTSYRFFNAGAALPNRVGV